MKKLLFFVAFLISYGSLYPFSFDIAAIDSGRLQLFIGHWSDLTKTSNTLSNIALFIPFGVVGMLAFPKQNISRRFLVIMIISFVLGLLLQVLQLFIPQRIPAVYDVIWNLAGTGLGAFVCVAFVSYLPDKLKQENVLSVPVILIGCWLAYRLIPFIPSIDWQLVKTSLKPLLLQPSFSLVDSLQDMTGWLVVAFIWPREFMPRIGKYNIAILILPVFILEIFFVDNVLTLSNVIGAVFAVAIWWGILSRSRNKDILIVILLLIVIFLQGFSPFAVREHYAAFQWLPFSGFLTGSMLVNTQVLFGKLFFYGSLIWVISRRSSNIALATVFTAIWVFMIEIGQINFSNHTPEITDLLIAVFTGIGIHYYHVKFRSLSEGQDTQQQEHMRILGQSDTHRAIENKSAAFPPKGQTHAALKNPVILLFLGGMVPAIIIYMTLRVPGIPYNVRELFRGGFFYISIFSFALLWIGVSAAYAGDRISSSPRSYITIPRLVFTTAIISYLLFSISVTTESILDIVGSSNMLWQVKEKKIWGDIGAAVFSVLDWPAGIEFVERIIRYLALYSPPVFMLAIFSAIANDLARKPGMPVFRKLLLYVGFSLPWLVLCKVIAFDYSSTDNLNELIERSGKYGLGGGGYLYLLLVIVTAVSTFIAWSGRITLKWKITVALSLAVSVPVGWWLLNKGLVTNFTKYNTTYSGVDFLLGPDRKHKLSQTVLFLRWSVLQTVAIAMLAYGQYIALLFLERFKNKSASGGR